MSSIELNSSTILSESSTRFSARLFNKFPSAVNFIPEFCRVNNFFPNSSSSNFSCLERAGCVMCKISEARVKFSSRAAAKKYFKVCMFIKFSSVIKICTKKADNSERIVCLFYCGKNFIAFNFPQNLQSTGF